MRLWWGLLVLVLHLGGQKKSTVSALVADLPNGSNARFTAREIGRSLFSYREDPLAEEDRWTGLSEKARSEWTSSNQILRRDVGVRDVLRVTNTLSDTDIKVHVDIQIISPDNLISEHDRSRIETYGRAMQPRHHGTALQFRIAVAPQSVHKRLAMLSPWQKSNDVARYLEQIASTMGSPNVFFVILHSSDKTNAHRGEMTPFVGSGKVAWAFYSPSDAKLNVADFLRGVEQTAQHIFNPIPLYYPISVIQDLKIELIAYTPGRDHKAQWLKDFAWDRFEAGLRGMAVHGQRLRFSSLQVNAECPLCEKAFGGVNNPSRTFIKKAASVLSGGSVSDQTRTAEVPGEAVQRAGAGKTLQLYVLDTYMLRQGKALERIESVPLSSFPSLGIIVVRSSNKNSAETLPILLARAFMASAYGIRNPSLYLPAAGARDHEHGEIEASGVVYDILTRYLMQSMIELRTEEVNDIVRGILYFDVDPAKALGNGEYSKFWQRVNLLLYKLVHAKEIGGASSDAQTGLYVVFSTHHDIRSLRASFEIEDHSKTIERFRDPTLRCHFSRLKREALRASRLLESRHPTLRQTALACGSFSLTTGLWWLLLKRTRGLHGMNKME